MTKLIISDPEGVYKATLTIHDGFDIHFIKQRPNWWVCFWTKVFLGWEWKVYR